MLAIPLIIGLLSFVGGCQWLLQDREFEAQFEGAGFSQGFIERVDASECVSPKPSGYGNICAQSVDWWSPVESTDCGGEQCYELAWVVEYYDLLEMSYYPLVIPGFLPLLFLFLVIRKITKARAALEADPKQQARVND